MSRNMKDSGIAWLGMIPDAWDVSINKTVLQNVSIKNHPDAEVLSLYRDLGIVPKNSRDDNHNVTSENTEQYKFVECGDLVINKMKAWQGSLAVSNHEGIVSPAYYVCKFKNDKMDKKYIHHLLRSCIYAQQFECLSTGMRIGQWDLSIDDFLTSPLLIPPKEEQTKISVEIDFKCSQVDTLIENQKKQIEKLKQYKQSLITETTTKGLCSSVETKFSDLEWIEKIPSTWSVHTLKSSFVYGKGLPITKADLIDEGVAVISYGQIHAKYNCSAHIDERLFRYVSSSYAETHPQCFVNKGDFIFADTSEDVAGAGDFVYIDSDEQIFAGYHTIILKAKNKSNNRYLSYLFMSDMWKKQIQCRVSGVKLFSISRGILGKVSYILPPSDEQEKIADFLDSKCKNIDDLITIKEQKIEKLQQYKKSIIYEYVTGKKEAL